MKKLGTGIIFVCSLIALAISLKLLWNMGIYVDEHNTTPAAVCGGDFWNILNWFRLLLLGVTTVVSGIQLLKKS